ncbi:hypothetical protein ADIARSV_3890 [Arcticibacter svalbardensis MN12-7]|uniref:Uncharacterized protein n=1 Tax=Arcticibacter svalbardensis MN12-7 TaxID=1150600 RepID=R9GVH0_9SPHI|nr:hypothetical protein ADIARSV_3890 [Arcticibacter svalbardensis MN12-7]
MLKFRVGYDHEGTIGYDYELSSKNQNEIIEAAFCMLQ